MNLNSWIQKLFIPPGEEKGKCSGQILTLISIMICVSATEKFPQESPQLPRVPTRNLRHIPFFQVSLRHIQLSWRWPPTFNLPEVIPSFHHFKFFSRSFPFWKSPTLSLRLSTTTHWNLHLSLHSTILPTLKTCNILTLKQVFIHASRFSGMQSRLISASDHGRYNKSSTYTYNQPLIPPPR